MNWHPVAMLQAAPISAAKGRDQAKMSMSRLQRRALLGLGLALLVVAPSAQAGWITVQFNGDQYASVGKVDGTHGLSVTFGGLWAISMDNKTPPADVHPPHLEGDFANEPSGPSAATYNWTATGDHWITPSEPCRYIHFWWTGEKHHCGSTGNPGEYFEIAGSSPLVVDADDGSYTWPINGSETDYLSGRGV